MRNHNARCTLQQDQPLLLHHIMSGTPSDDELVAGLYSRVGGAHCTQAEGDNRLTNFRRGTAVWYLSKAAGAPCPFARAGIQLCEYNENGKIGMPINAGREKKRERDRLRKAGQKRKRLLRSCAEKDPESVSGSSDDEEKRPPKVKLTLRLKPSPTPTPSASSSDVVALDLPAGSMLDPQPSPPDYDAQTDQSDTDAMSVDSDDEDSASSSSSLPCSRPSATIPTPYHASVPGLGSASSPDLPLHSNARRRSPSVPYSALSGSPPPDSEEEDEDFHITMTGARSLSLDCLHTPSEDDGSAWEDDFFGELDADAETQWESPGPRSPSAQLDEDVVVKEEPTDVRGLLDAWEHLDNAATELKVIDIVAQAAAAERRAEQASSDDFATWSWPSMYPEEFVRVKQEDDETPLFFSDPAPPCESLSPIVPFDPCESPVDERALNLHTMSPAYEPHWRDVELLGPDSVKPHDLDDGAWHEYRVTRAAAAAASSPPSPTLSHPTLAPLDVQSAGFAACAGQGRLSSISSPSLLASLTSLCLQTPAMSVPFASSLATAPQPTEEPSASEETIEDKPLAIHTIIPSFPAILATLCEGVPIIGFLITEVDIPYWFLLGVAVYQLTWGSSTLFRRVDTDFVNASLISKALSVATPTAPSAVVITAGSPLIRGTWVSLSIAQDFAKDEPTLATFLSDNLRSLFPATIRALQPAVGLQATHPEFGHQFRSASEARRQGMTSHRLELPPREFEVSWEDHLSTHPPFILATAALDEHRPAMEEISAVVETPLSPTEEEMFHVLCATSDWEASPTEEYIDPPTGALLASASLSGITDSVQERPLRRSKRVANTAATRSRTRSSRRGSRTSLS